MLRMFKNTLGVLAKRTMHTNVEPTFEVARNYGIDKIKLNFNPVNVQTNEQQKLDAYLKSQPNLFFNKSTPEQKDVTTDYSMAPNLD